MKSLLKILCFLLITVTLTSVSFSQDQQPTKQGQCVTYPTTQIVCTAFDFNFVPTVQYVQTPLATSEQVASTECTTCDAFKTAKQVEPDSKIGWRISIYNKTLNKNYLAGNAELSKVRHSMRC